MSLSQELAKLNPSQLKAVESIEGPVLVVAGPGSGKTQVLTLRIARILEKTDALPQNILCITFTESGALAMKQRLYKLIGKDAYHVNISTFHAFCNEIIQSYPEKFSFARELKKLDDLTKIKLFREVIEDQSEALTRLGASKLIPFHNKFFYQNEILRNIQTLKRENITPEMLENLCKESLEELNKNPDINTRTKKPKKEWMDKVKKYEKNLELSQIYFAYQEKLREQGFYDYDDMILFVIKKFQEDEELLANYQEKYLYIMVDEFQDTNGSQNKIIKLLSSFDKSPNLFAVGDDDQSIYRFQGANVENLLFFTKEFENVQTIVLDQNYRSTQVILNAASDVIKNNSARLVNFIHGLKKDLKSHSDSNHPLEIYSFKDSASEDDFITEKIKQLNSNGVSYSDIAIFYRSHKDSEFIAESLLKAKIPIKLAIGDNILNEKVIIQLINILKVINYKEKERDLILFKVLFYEFLKLDRVDVFKITTYASDRKISLFNALLESEALSSLNLKDSESLNKFANSIINFKADSSNRKFINFITEMCEQIGYFDYIFNSNLENINSVVTFFDYIKETNKNNPDLTLTEFLEDLNIYEENKINIKEEELDLQKDAVSLMTAHKSKGLEFRHVFIIHCTDGNWGNKRSTDKLKLPDEVFLVDEQASKSGETTGETRKLLDIDQNEEERRLFYVALTRAKENLYITYAKEYPTENGTKTTEGSEFIAEINPQNAILKDFESSEEDKNKLMTRLHGIPYVNEEVEYLKLLVSKFKLSPSSLNEYLECPLKFKFNRLIKVPKVKSRPEILGSAIHYALEHYFRQLIKNEAEGTARKGVDYLIFMFNEYLKKELIDPTDFKEIEEEGQKILKEYFEYAGKDFKAPLFLEYNFGTKNITLELEKDNVVQLTGKVDRVEQLDGQNVRIIDYKTSKPSTRNQILGQTKDSDGSIYRQLVFYKILTELDPNFKKNLASPKLIAQEVQVIFLKPDLKKEYKTHEFEIAEEDTKNLLETIKEVSLAIQNLDFNGSDAHPLCGECEYCEELKLSKDAI